MHTKSKHLHILFILSELYQYTYKLVYMLYLFAVFPTVNTLYFCLLAMKTVESLYCSVLLILYFIILIAKY